MTLAVEKVGLEHLPGSGFLVPPVEGRTIKASTFSFRKWAWTGELSDDLAHLRASFGRAREEADLQRDDADLVAVAVAEVGEALGHPLPRVVDAHVQRWGGGLPQYAVGHVDRVASHPGRRRPTARRRGGGRGLRRRRHPRRRRAPPRPPPPPPCGT